MPVCAVHIHTGMTCTGDAGGHYYTGTVTADPWTSIVYSSDSTGATSGSLTVTTGGSSGEVAGRAMIIHSHGGDRIGCAILGAATQVRLTASDFAPYYSYSGSLAVSGTVGPMTTVGTTQTFYWSLSGVDKACSSGPDTSKANSCGIHIHKGTTCTGNAGGHYYTGSVTEDPWTSIVYTPDADGKSTGSLSVNTGALSSEVKGRAMIIHGHDGGRIACAILSDGVSSALHASSFVKYYNYAGPLAVSGSVGPMTTASETTQTFSYSLSGVDAACSSGPDTSKANSCGSESHGLDVL